MTFFLGMLPIYLLGNFHCIGMCGPLVMMLGKHPYRYLYFLGRVLSFSLVSGLAGGAGALLTEILYHYNLPALVSFFFGITLIIVGGGTLWGWKAPTIGVGIGQTLSLLMLKERPWPTFLFGFFTAFLPCGQSLIVFSASALFGGFWMGFFNGLFFAASTTPSLWIAMHAHRILAPVKRYYNILIGSSALLIGGLAICRGLADLEWIPHLILNQRYHLIIF